MTAPIGPSPQPIQKRPIQNPAFGQTSPQQRGHYGGSGSPRFAGRNNAPIPGDFPTERPRSATPKPTEQQQPIQQSQQEKMDKFQRQDIQNELQAQVKKLGTTEITPELKEKIEARTDEIQQAVKSNPHAVSPQAPAMEQLLLDTAANLTALAKQKQPKMPAEIKEFFSSMSLNALNYDPDPVVNYPEQLKQVENGLRQKLEFNLGQKYKNRLPEGVIEEESLKIYHQLQTVPRTEREKLVKTAAETLTQKPADPNARDKKAVEAARTARKLEAKSHKDVKRQKLEAEAKKQEAFNNSLFGKVYNYFNTPPAPKAAQAEEEATPVDSKDQSTSEIKDTTTPETPAINNDKDAKGTAPKPPAAAGDSTPVESGESAEAVAETNETQDAKEADDKQPAQPTESTNTDNEKKADDKKDSILHGWKKTKATVGTALLAGGIALKMTLIGIIPGLIMAGAGAALLGWAGINWMSGGSGDDKKVESDSSEKGDKKDKKADEANAA